MYKVFYQIKLQTYRDFAAGRKSKQKKFITGCSITACEKHEA